MQQQSFSTLSKKEIVRALSINEPYASLMLHGKIETRSRLTHIRGKVLICACQKPYSEIQIQEISGEWQTGRIFETLRLNHVKEMPGHAIAIADLVDCRPMTPTDEDKCFVAYREGLYCWIFDNVQAIEPFPYKGSQGWTILSEDIINKIKVIR